MTGFEVRRADRNDLELLKPLRVSFFQDQAAQGMANGPVDVAAHVEETTAKLLDSRFVSIFVATPAGEQSTVAGYMMGQIKIVTGGYRYSRIGFPQELFVLPEHRREGMAGALYAALKEAFRQQGVSWIELQVLISNDVSRRFWERRGFAPRLLMMDSPLL